MVRYDRLDWVDASSHSHQQRWRAPPQRNVARPGSYAQPHPCQRAMWKVTLLLTPALWPRCSRSWALFLLPFWSLVSRCQCCRFMCTKVLASAHSSSARLQQPVCCVSALANYSGRYADTRGAKRAVVAGLLIAVAGGLLYLASIPFVGAPSLSAAILLGGRALLGAAESFVITGAVSWGHCSGRPRKCRACDRVDRHGHVYLPCIRGAARCHALC